jgi:hypothetical protein
MIKYDKKDHTLEVDTPNAKLKLDQNDLLSLRQSLFDLPAHNSSELINLNYLKDLYSNHQKYLTYLAYNMVYNLILKYIYEDFNTSEWYIPYDYEGVASFSGSELIPGYKDTILWGGIPDKLILEQAELVLKDLESHGIKIKNSYTEDGELIVYVDESIFKDGK